MKAWWLTAALLVLTPALVFAQQGAEDDEELQAEQQALNRLIDAAVDDAAPEDELPEEIDPEDLRIVAQRTLAAEEDVPAATEMNLSGSDVAVDVLGSDSLVITGNEHDLAILKELIGRLDRELPSKELRVVTLKERPANEVANNLQSAVRELYPRDEERPESRTSITAVSSNILLIVAPGTKVDQIVAVAKAIDSAAPAIKADMMVFQVVNRKASEAAERLTEIITDLRRKQGADAAEEFTITPNDADGTIMVFGPVAEEQTIRMILEQIDAEAVAGFGELRLVVFPLVNAQADDLVQMFEDMLEVSETREGAAEAIRRLIMLKQLPGEAPIELPPLNLEKTLRLIAHDDTNSVLVATVEENIEPVGEIIQLLDDVPMSVDMGLRVYPLRFADAETVGDSLRDMFEEGRDLPSAAEGGNDVGGAVPTTDEGEALVYDVGIVPDLRTNTVFVTGRPVQLTLVDRIVAVMDQPGGGTKFPLKLLFLGDNVDATRISQIIETLWEQRIEALEAQNAGNAAVERERVFLAVDIRTNALVISASEQNYEEIEQICMRLDTASDKLIDQIRIINCSNTSAGDLASKIEELWERKADLRREGDIPEDLPVIVADQRSNALVIASSPEDYEEIKRLVDKLESQPLAPIASIRLMQLVNNDASEISQMLEDLFQERMEQRLAQGQEENPSDRVALAFDAPTNTILVASSKENFDEMTRIVDVLDAEPNIEGVVRTFVLNNAEASKVADLIEELFDEGLYTPTKGLDSSLAEERMEVALVADPRANAIIVSASPINLNIIEGLVTQMDNEDVPLQENTRLFQLQYADAVKLTDMLERLFEGMRSNAPDPDMFTEPTIIPDDRSNWLIVSGSRDSLRRCEDLIAQLDRKAGEPTSVFEIYGLQHASAINLAPIMQDMFEKREEGGSDERTPINIYAEEGTNALIVSGSKDDQVIVEGLLDLLDKPSTIARQFQIFPLAKAKAQPLADRLDEMFQSRAEAAGGDARADAIAVQADERTNSLIAWGSPTQLENISAIIRRLDTAEPAVEMALRVIQLKQALAEDLSEVLQETLIGDTGGAGEDSQAVIVTYTVQNDDGTAEERKLVRQDLTITPDSRTNTLMVMAPADSMDMLEAMIRDFDRIRPIVAEVRLFPLVNADAAEIVEKLQELFEAEGEDGEQTLTFGDGGGSVTVAGGTGSSRQVLKFTADRRTNTVIAAGSEIDLNMVERLVYHLDAHDVDERMTLVYETRNIPAEAVAQAIRDFAQSEEDRLSEIDDEASLIRQAERHITAIDDEESNSVILGVSPRYYDTYMSLVHELDRPPAQVMIQVLIAEVTLDNSVDLGLDFAVQDLSFTENAVVGPNGTIQGKDYDFVFGTDLGAGGGALGGFNFTITGEDFSFLLKALESDSKLEVLSRPTLLVENNEEATITIGDRVPIPQGSSVTDAGVSNTVVNYEEVGIILEVTPHINPDGFVNLEIHPEISQISDSSVQLTEGLTAPVFSERSADTVVTVKDGETVVIGGLITSSDRDTETKIPLLGDVPGLGMLFRNTGKTSRKTELLMVLTVNVLRTEEDLRRASIEQRDKTGLLENVSRNPLMEGLRIRAEEPSLGPEPVESEPVTPPVQRNRDLYGPTPDVYGPQTPPTKVEHRSQKVRGSGAVTRVYGPTVPPRGSPGVKASSALARAAPRTVLPVAASVAQPRAAVRSPAPSKSVIPVAGRFDTAPAPKVRNVRDEPHVIDLRAAPPMRSPAGGSGRH